MPLINNSNPVKQDISIYEFKDTKKIDLAEKIDLIKKIAGDWANTATKYMKKYQNVPEKRLVAYDAEDMASTLKDLLSKKYLKDEKITLLAACDSKKRIWGIALASFKTGEDSLETSIENIVVNPRIIKALNKGSKISGVGTALMKDIAQRTLKKKGTDILLHSLKSSESYYKKLGFIKDPYNQGANSATLAMKLEHKRVKQLSKI